MPDVTTASLCQTAVLWEAATYDDYGQLTVSDPEEVPVRWVEGLRESSDPLGNVVTTDVTADMDREIAIGSTMWLGKLADYTAAETKLVVVSYRETPDIKGRHPHRSVGLNRQSNTLPEIT